MFNVLCWCARGKLQPRTQGYSDVLYVGLGSPSSVCNENHTKTKVPVSTRSRSKFATLAYAYFISPEFEIQDLLGRKHPEGFLVSSSLLSHSTPEVCSNLGAWWQSGSTKCHLAAKVKHRRARKEIGWGTENPLTQHKPRMREKGSQSALCKK